MANRIQLRRTKGWRKPADAIVVARPSRWGNPFRVDPERPEQVVDQHGNAWSVGVGNDWRELAVDLFRTFTHPASTSGFDYPLYSEIYTELRGHDLACWCPLDAPCHADDLLEIPNGPVQEHEHQQRFDGDDPYLVCWCGARWDALTGTRIGGAS